MMIIIILKNVSNSNPGLARIPISFASSDITNYIRDLTGKQLESIFTKSKGKRAFTSFRFRNRSEAKSSENRNGITRVIENLEQHKRWIRVPTRLMPLNLLGPEAQRELTSLKGGEGSGYKQNNKM